MPTLPRPRWLILLVLFFTVVGGGRAFSSPDLPVAQAAPCTVSGFITSNTTWGPASCQPYIVSGGNVVVQAGVTLTLLPGTTVKFDSLQAMTIQGRLVARGTAGSPITFTSNQPSPAKDDWGYLYFTDSSDDAVFDSQGNYVNGSALQYAVVEYAGGVSVTNNGAVRVDASSPYLDHNTIRRNGTIGVLVWNGGAPLITDNTITANDGGVSVDGVSTIRGNTITNNIVSGSGGGVFAMDTITITGNTISGNIATSNGGGVYARGFILVEGNTIIGNTASDNGGGLYLRSQAAIRNNSITGNSAWGNGGGIFLRSGYRPLITQNNLHSNTAALGDDLYDDNASGSADVNAENNYWGTTNPSTIESHIWHNVDDAALGLVDYFPFLLGPIDPFTTPTPTTTATATNTQTPTRTLTPTPTITPGGPTLTPTRTSTPSKTPPVRFLFHPLLMLNYVTYFVGPCEVEDNDRYQDANGPLNSGQDYCGLTNDNKDYFSVYLVSDGQMTIDVTGSESSGLQLQLFHQNTDYRVAFDVDTPLHLAYAGPPGWYYVYLFAATPANTPYTLRVIYP